MKIGHAIILAILALIFIPLVSAQSIDTGITNLNITKNTNVTHYSTPGTTILYN